MFAGAIKKYWKIAALWLLLYIPLINLALAILSIFFFIYWPKKFSEMDFAQFSTNKPHLVMMAHGVRDTPQSWATPLKDLLDQKSRDLIVDLDWSIYANDAMRCAVYGKRIGKRIGEILAQESTLESVHLIGHSCGSFVVYGLCQELKDSRGDVLVQATYLDPVSIYVVFWNYGLNNFGSCADYAEAYIDTEDGVPGSNELLPNTHTYDVTAVRLGSGHPSAPHNWPTVYYSQLAAEGGMPDYRSDRAIAVAKPEGMLEQVNE